MEAKQATTSYNRRKATTRRKSKTIRKSGNGSFVTNKQLNGGRITVPANPPDTALSPWYHYTVHFAEKGTKTKNVGEIVQQMSRQMDPNSKIFVTGSYLLTIRIKSIMCWNISGKTLAFSPHDFSSYVPKRKNVETEDSDTLGGWVDTGGQDSYPKIGYQFPHSIATIPVENDEGSGHRSVYQVTCADSDTVVVYINLEWRFPVAMVTTLDLKTYIESIALDVQTMSKDIEASRGHLKNLDGDKPSVVETLAGHAAVVAPYFLAGYGESPADEEIRRLRRLLSQTHLAQHINFSGNIELHGEKSGNPEPGTPESPFEPISVHANHYNE